METLTAFLFFTAVALYGWRRLASPQYSLNNLMAEMAQCRMQELPLEEMARRALYYIPPGRVMVFSDIVRLMGVQVEPLKLVQAIRLVAREDDPPPWWRLVRRKGEVGLLSAFNREEEQRERLKREGVALQAEGVVLKEALWP